MEHYETALYLRSDDEQLLGKTAITALQQMQYEKAIPLFEKLLVNKPKAFPLLYSLWPLPLRDETRFGEAIEYWEKEKP